MPGMKADAAQQRRAALLAVQCCALVPLSTARRTAGELLGESQLLTKAGCSLLRMKAAALPDAKLAFLRSLGAARSAQRGSGSGGGGDGDGGTAEAEASKDGEGAAGTGSGGDDERRRAALMEVACCQQNLGAVMSAEGDLIAALRFLRDALAATEEAVGTPDPTAVSTPEMEALLNNLGTVCHASKQFAESRGYFERARTMQEVMYGSACGATLNNIGANFLAQGDRCAPPTHTHTLRSAGSAGRSGSSIRRSRAAPASPTDAHPAACPLLALPPQGWCPHDVEGGPRVLGAWRQGPRL